MTSIKLDRNNFLLWQNIALPILRSYKLEGHLTGKDECPEHSIIIPPSEDEPKGLTLPNQEHDIWLAADQLLVGWLYNSMIAEVASQVTGYDTAKNLWDALQEYYGLQAASQQDYLKRMLQQTRKGSTKMSEYLALMKGYADNLYLAGSPVSTRDLISYVIAGLDEEYTPIVVVLQNQDLSWTDVQNRLLTYENCQ